MCNKIDKFSIDSARLLCSSRFSDLGHDKDTINRDVRVRDGPVRSGCTTSIDADNAFILNTHIVAKLRKKKNLKTCSNEIKSTHGQIKKHEEQIAGLIGSLKYYCDLFHSAA